MALLLAWSALVVWHSAKPLMPGTHFASQTSRLPEADVDFQSELPAGRYAPACALAAVDHAEQMIVLDRSPVSGELAKALLARKRTRANLKIVVVTDPGNEVYGGTPPQTLASLEVAGIIVARVRLDALRDSNPLYSGLWRLAFGWWSNPFDETPGKVTLPAWSRRQNFKADERQLLVADDGSGGWIAIVASRGAARCLVLRGSLARAMIFDELQIARWSTNDDRLPPSPSVDGLGVGSVDARFLTEGAIGTALLDAIAAAGKGDQISVAVENLSARRVIAALMHAAARGAGVQVLLARRAVPNQAVAGELVRGGLIEVRWHSGGSAGANPSLLVVRHGRDVWIVCGSASFTRRNLGDLNLEAEVELHMPQQAAPARAIADYFAAVWTGSAPYADFSEDSAAAYWRYRVGEATGLSSF